MRIAAYSHGLTPKFETSMPGVIARRAPHAVAQPPGPPTLAEAYRSSGGVIGSDALTQWLALRREQPISVLARWIVDRRLVHFHSEGQLVLPLCQFELPGLNVLPAVAEVIAELGGCFDDDETARWFIEPNCWLHGASPAAAMATDPAAVLQAARADRFALQG